MNLEHIPELLEELNAGNLTREDVYSLCIEAMEALRLLETATSGKPSESKSPVATSQAPLPLWCPAYGP